eukprot:6213009-Pleurochrysis_carterae.AAC.5
MHVRSAVRRGAIEFDGAVYCDLTSLKEELILIRRRVRVERFNQQQQKRLADLEGMAAACDATIADLSRYVKAPKKNDVLHQKLNLYVARYVSCYAIIPCDVIWHRVVRCPITRVVLLGTLHDNYRSRNTDLVRGNCNLGKYATRYTTHYVISETRSSMNAIFKLKAENGIFEKKPENVFQIKNRAFFAKQPA